MDKDLQCCVANCEKPLDADYWNSQYTSSKTGWDLGDISTPIKKYIDKITNKSVKILIPGCGNAYEAEYLLSNGFTNITLIDIAPDLINKLQKKFENKTGINIVLGDFFEHADKYDLIIEQTFFCALPPFMRQQYVHKMFHLLENDGQIVGLLFNRTFEQGPPFGGSKEEYLELFKNAFHIHKFNTTNDSVAPRAGTELWFEMQKNTEAITELYKFNGITCNGCMTTVIQKFQQLPNILNASMSSDYKKVLLVSNKPILLQDLQNEINYDSKYSINKY